MISTEIKMESESESKAYGQYSTLNAMDNVLDSPQYDLDLMKSGEPSNYLSGAYCLRSSSPDSSNYEISERVASLEIENERLRINLRNLKIELNSKIAANQGLKNKIAEFYIEGQESLQEKLKIQNNMKDVESQLSVAKNSTKWYQYQLHEVLASRKTLQIEVTTYKDILKQKQQIISDLLFQSKQLNQDYTKLVSRYKEEKRILQDEIDTLRSKKRVKDAEIVETSALEVIPNLSIKLEASEEELRETKVQLISFEQSLLSAQSAKKFLESTFEKHLKLTSLMEDDLQRCHAEKNELADNLRNVQFEIQKLKSENGSAQIALMSLKQNRSQFEEAISQVQIQLSKMIGQFKLIKMRNLELEETVRTMEENVEESKRARLLFLSANSLLLKKLKKEKIKVNKLKGLISQEKFEEKGDEGNEVEDSVKKILKNAPDENKELKEQLKLMTKVSEESVDEGYADGTSLGLFPNNLPSPPGLSPISLMKITEILSRSKHLMTPIQLSINKLQTKIEKFTKYQNSLDFRSSTLNFLEDETISINSSTL